MSDINILTRNSGIFQEILMLFGKLVHSSLVREIEYLKVENSIMRRKLGKRITVTPGERRRLIKYGLPLGGEIKRIISIVGYSTFRRWVNGRHNKRKKISKRGRPRTRREIRELVLKLARENNWGYTRILGELRKLEIENLSRSTVKNILKENGLDPAPKRGEDSWDDFIKRHFQTLWACDFFTKTVWTLLGPKTFHALFFINVHTRKVHIAGITKHPTRAWVLDHTRSVSFLFSDDDKKLKLLIRDGDSKYTKQFDNIFKEFNMKVKTIPFKSPNLNPYAEGWVGTIKRECLDHFLIFGERHFRYLLEEYVKYYNTVRPHSSMGNKPLDHEIRKKTGNIKCELKLGGMIKHYYRE